MPWSKSWRYCCENHFLSESVEGRRGPPAWPCPWTTTRPAPRKMLARKPCCARAAPRLPQCSELDVVRHFTKPVQAQLQCGCQLLFPWLLHHECTTPSSRTYVAFDCRALPACIPCWPSLSGELAQGALQCLYDAEQWLCEVTGMKAFTFQPMAGGQSAKYTWRQAHRRLPQGSRAATLHQDAHPDSSPLGTNLQARLVTGGPSRSSTCPSRDGMVDPAASEESHGQNTPEPGGPGPDDDQPQHTMGLLELHLPRIGG